MSHHVTSLLRPLLRPHPLQEVTPQFAETVLAEPWVREQYFVTCPTACVPYGQLLLSKCPLEMVYTLRSSTPLLSDALPQSLSFVRARQCSAGGHVPMCTDAIDVCI